MESPSLEADASAVTCNGAVPELGFRLSVEFGGASRTVTWVVELDASPAVSVTVTFTVNVPADVYVWAAVGPACGPFWVPSPKSKV